MANQKGTEGTQRGNRQRFPYEPRVIGGKLLMPAELQAIHRGRTRERAHESKVPRVMNG